MSGVRRSLMDVLPPQEDVTPAPSAPARPAAPAQRQETPAPPKPPAAPRKLREQRAAAAVPLFRQLEAIQARLRTDQRDALNEVARRLERDRPTGQGARITSNTLIRVAVDALLDRRGQLTGTSEEELRAALSRSSD